MRTSSQQPRQVLFATLLIATGSLIGLISCVAVDGGRNRSLLMWGVVELIIGLGFAILIYGGFKWARILYIITAPGWVFALGLPIFSSVANTSSPESLDKSALRLVAAVAGSRLLLYGPAIALLVRHGTETAG
jgi:hypothetical protein